MVIAVKSSQRHGFREAVVTQILIDIAHKVVVASTDKTETTAQTRQAIELRQGAGDNQIIILVHQWGDIIRVRGDETGISLIYQHHRVIGDVLHDAPYLLRRQAVASGIVRRCQQQHTGMDAVGVFDHLVHIIGKGIILFVQRIHLEGAVAFAGHLVIIPPRELRYQDLLVVTLHQIIVDSVLQDILTAVCQEHLFLGHAIDLTQAYRDDALLALVVDTGIEAQRLRIEVPDGFLHLLTGLKIKLIPIEIIHFLFHLYYFCVQR